MRQLIVIGLLCGAALTSSAYAQTPASPKSSTTPRVPIKEYRLDNGLRVLLSEDHSAPTFGLSVTYNVGSRDEKAGRTGFAHLFEHMMFQGSKNVGKGEHMILVQNNGGEMNGTTNEDRTNYFEAFPANQLDLGLYLEADRMRSLAVTQGNLDNQRNAVQEERRLGVDNQPYGKTREMVGQTAYDNFAYKHSVIGSMEDLNAATVDDVKNFFKIYYAPNNAVLTLVGDFQPEEALAKIKKYFGDIPGQPKPPEPDMAEPTQKAERRLSLEDNFAPMQRLDMVWKVPAGNTPDWYAMDVLTSVLGGGQSSRLYQSLVKDKEIAGNASAFVRSNRGTSLVYINVQLRPGKDPKEAEKLVYAELDRLKDRPVEDWELQKARMMDRRHAAESTRSTLGRAIEIGQDAVYFNNPNLINERTSLVSKVTKDDVQRAAKKYLTPENRTVILTSPKAKSMASSAPNAPVQP